MRAAAVLAAALILRLAVIALGPGLPYDVGLFQEWAARMAAGGPAGFYDPTLFADYPPGLLYLLWPLGLLFGTVPALAVRLLSIPFDLAIVATVMRIVAQARPGSGWIGAGLAYALNPGLALAGPYWGQVDAVSALLVLLSVVAMTTRRFAAAGALVALAALVKPQAAIIVAPLAVVAIAELRRRRRARPLTAFVLAGAVTTVAVVAPFAPTPEHVAALWRDAAGSHELSGIFVLNFWTLTAGLSVPDDTPFAGLTIRLWGIILFAAAVVGVLTWLWVWLPRGRAFGTDRATDLGLLLAAVVLVQVAFYELAPRIHERYLFPAFAVLAPLIAASATASVAYVVLSIVFAASLLFAFAVLEPGLAFLGPTSPLLDPGLLVGLAGSGLGTLAVLALRWRRAPPALA